MKRLFHLTIIACAGYGASVQSGFWNGTFSGQQLFYYTILSNLIIFGYYLYLFIVDNFSLPRKSNPNIQGALTLMIVITGIVYHTLLAPQFQGVSPYGIDPLANFLIHTYVPLAVLIDWIIFVSIKNPKKLKPIYWLTIPLGYWILSMIYASFKIPFVLTGDYYAYYFIDLNHLGFWRVFLNIILLSLVFLLLGYTLKFLKKVQNKYNFFI